MSATIATAAPGTRTRYSGAMQAFHWATAALMFAILPLAWVMVSLPDDAAGRGLLYTLHKSVGVTILALVAVRLAWRATRPVVPRELPGMPRWMALAGHANHWLLYAILFAMPVSGYVMSSASGHPVSYFGLFTLPGLPLNKAMAGVGRTAHLLVQWAVYALVALHLLATAWHVAVRRDGLLARELPAQNP